MNSPYLYNAFYLGKRKEIVNIICKFLRSKTARKLYPLANTYKIAFRGNSGALIAPIVSYKLDIPLCLIPKPTENRHSLKVIEGDIATADYIIIDDLVCSGCTIREIKSAVEEANPNAKLNGVILYHSEIPYLHNISDCWVKAFRLD